MLSQTIQRLAKIILVIIFCSALVACGGGDDSSGSDSGSGPSPKESDLNSDSSSVDLSKPLPSSQLLTQQNKQSNYSNVKTIKVTNTSSSTIKNLSVNISGNVEGVTTSGCESKLGGGKACQITVKANPKAHGQGHIVVSGKNTASLTIPVFVGAAPIYFGHTNIVAPSDKRAPVESYITIINDSKFPAKINSNNITVVDGSGNSDHIAVNYSYTEYNSCLNSRFKQGNTITLNGGDICNLPLKVTQGAEGHAMIKLSGNFFRAQYAPVNVAPAYFKVSANTSDQIKFKLDRDNGQNWSSEFNINRLDVLLDHEASKSLSNFRPGHIRQLTFQNVNPGPHMLTFSGDNLSDNIDPVIDYVIPDNAQSYLTINNIPRQNLTQPIQTSAFAGLNLTANNVTVKSIQLSHKIQATKPGPVGSQNEYAGQSIPECKQALNSSADGDKTCTLWLKPKDSQVELAFNNQKASLTVVYADQQGQTHEQTVTFNVNRELLAAGRIKLPPNRDNNQQTRVDNSSIMNWNGYKWHWNQGGQISFDDINYLAVNKRGQPCVNDGSIFACFNGYKWLQNNEGLPSAQNKSFRAMIKLPNNDQDFGNILSEGLVAVASADDHKIFYLRPYATNGYFDGSKPSWRAFNFPYQNWGNITAGKGVLFASLADADKARVDQVSIKYAIQGSKHNRVIDTEKEHSNVGQPIAINRSQMTHQFALLAQGDQKVFVGGQENGHPVVYKNTKDKHGDWQKHWQSIGGPSIKGQIINLKHGSKGPLMTVMAKNKTHGFVYQYTGSHQWQKVADKTDPVTTVYYDQGRKRYYIGTFLDNLNKSSEKDHDIKDSFVLTYSHSQGPQKWSSLGGIKTYGGYIATLTPVGHIKITGYQGT